MQSKQYTFGRSLNDDWIRDQRKQKSNLSRTTTSKKDSRIRSAPAIRCSTTASSLFLDSEDDEISDTVQEFKLTLQLFKRLTNQVREVNQYMNKHRIYSFKHHLNNEGIASPALRRSQLAAALSRREIPATQAPYEPITDLGPPTISSRPVSRQEREIQSSGPRPSSLISSRPASSTCRVYTPQPSGKSTLSGSAKNKRKEKVLREADELAKEEWIENDEDFDDLFVPEEIDPEDMDFRFHDPYPRTWVDETVEDACFRGSKKVDPFMHRLEELENVQDETVLWEKLKEEKSKQSSTSSVNKQTVTRNIKSAKVVSSGRGSSARYPTLKTTSGSSLLRAKSSVNRLKRTSSAGKSGTTSNPVSGSEESDITTFRNSGYTMGVSFILGSMYPETLPKQKQKLVDTDRAKNSKQVTSASTESYSSPYVLTHATQTSKAPYCEACHLRKSAGTKKHSNCKSNVPTLKAMRSQYAIKAAECYDIVDIAQTFDPPCKNTINKFKSQPTTEEKAAMKGLVPGKSLRSQRRISLTSEGMAVRGINPALKLSRPVTGKRSKSSKVIVKWK